MSCLGYIRDYTSSYVRIVINRSLAKGLKDEDCNGIHPRLTFNGMACGGVLLCPRIVHFLRSLREQNKEALHLLRRNIRRRLLSFQQKTVERTGNSFCLLT